MADEVRKEYKTDVDLYERARVGYSRESVKFLLENVGALNSTKPITILEVGAGTGKFTRVMVDVLGDNSIVRVIASDLMPPMCEKFKKMVPGVEVKQYAAEKIELPDESIDVVISAQGFHWYGNQKSVSEIHRVLVPGGMFGLIWNSKDTSESWVAEIEAVLQPFYKRDRKPSHMDKKWKGHIDSSKLFSEVEGNEDSLLDHFQQGDVDDIVLFNMCAIAVVKSSDSEKKKIESQIRGILARLGALKFTMPYVTHAYWCTKNIN